MRTFIRAQSAPWASAIELYIGTPDRKTKVVNIVLEKVEEGHVPEPSFTLDETTAQVLMDDLWNSGVRPTEGAGSAGAMRATERHLEDMRTLVFNKPTTAK